jgi:alcohol dehydrogenase
VLAENIAALERAPRAEQCAAAAGEPEMLARYAEIGRLLADNPGLAPAEARRVCVDFTKNLLSEMALPRLGQFGTKEADIPAQVALAKKSNGIRQNPVALPDDVLARILRQAL